jgi:hypothetical protein
MLPEPGLSQASGPTLPAGRCEIKPKFFPGIGRALLHVWNPGGAWGECLMAAAPGGPHDEGAKADRRREPSMSGLFAR